MIIKQTKGKDIHAVLAYALEESHAPEVIGGSIGGSTLAEMSQRFLVTLRLKPDIKNPVQHTTFSFEPGELISNATMRAIGDAYLTQMGWDLPLTQRIYIRHYDHENEERHPHFHLIASRIQFDRKLVSDSWDYYRGKALCRELEAEFDLESAAAPRKLFREPTRWEGMVYERSGVLSAKMDLQRRIFDAVQTVAEQSNQMGELVEAIASAGVGVLPWRNPETNEIDGISYRLGEFVMRGQALGAAFTWSGLQYYLGIDYESQRDTDALQRVEQSEIEANRRRLEARWGTVTVFTNRYRKRCKSIERDVIDAGLGDRTQRGAFIQQNFHQLAIGLGVPETPSPVSTRTLDDAATVGADAGECQSEFASDLRPVRQEAVAAGERHRSDAYDPPGDIRPPALNGGGGEGVIYTSTIELRDRLAALLRAGEAAPERTVAANPEWATDFADRIRQRLAEFSGDATANAFRRADPSDLERAVNPNSRTLGAGDPSDQTDAASTPTIADQVRQRIQLVTGYTGSDRPDTPDSTSGTGATHQSTDAGVPRLTPATLNGGDTSNQERSPSPGLSIREQIQQRIKLVTSGGISNPTNRGGSDQRAEPLNSGNADSRSARGRGGAESSPTNQGHTPTDYQPTDPERDLLNRAGGAANPQSSGDGVRHADSTPGSGIRGDEELNRSAQATGEETTEHQRGIQLESDTYEPGRTGDRGGIDLLQLPAFHNQPLTNPAPNTAKNPNTCTPNNTNANRTIENYARLYAQYDPQSGDTVRNDFAIALAALLDNVQVTEVACILTRSPLAQQNKENLERVQAYIETLIADANQHKQELLSNPTRNLDKAD